MQPTSLPDNDLPTISRRPRFTLVHSSASQQYQRSWDALQEDEHGSLQAAVLALQQEQRRKRCVA